MQEFASEAELLFMDYFMESIDQTYAREVAKSRLIGRDKSNM
jgi:hypothetical protein